MSNAEAVRLAYDDGVRAVELGRESVDAFVSRGQREEPGSMRDAFYARTGALVRLQSTRGRRPLRGCAGAYMSDDQLGHAIVDAAIGAASGDSCGSEIEPKELSDITVSVCIVTDTLRSSNPLDNLQLGSHGVAIDAGGQHAWLHPRFATENGWSGAEFLSRTCRKAGLAPTAWQDSDTVVTLFEGQIFREREPVGSVQEL